MSATDIENLFPNYFKFGKNTKTGQVDIATIVDDTFVSCSEEHADRLIADREATCKLLEELAAEVKLSNPELYKMLITDKLYGS